MARGVLALGFSPKKKAAAAEHQSPHSATNKQPADNNPNNNIHSINNERQPQLTSSSTKQRKQAGPKDHHPQQDHHQQQDQPRPSSQHYVSSISTLTERSAAARRQGSSAVTDDDDDGDGDDGVIDESASPVKGAAALRRPSIGAPAAVRGGAGATAAGEEEKGDDNDEEYEEYEEEGEFVLFSEEEVKAMEGEVGGAAHMTMGPRDTMVEALLLILTAAEREGAKNERKIRGIKYGSELLGAITAVKQAVEEHKLTLQDAVDNEKEKDTSFSLTLTGGLEASDHSHAARVICDVRNVATGIQVLIEKVRVSRTMLFGRRRAFKHAFRDYQRRLLETCSNLLATLCTEMASQAAGPAEDGAESPDARVKRLAADRLLFSSSQHGGSRSTAWDLYAWAAEHGSAPAMLSLAHLCGGEGGEEETKRFWMEKAALHGSREAMTELGVALITEAVGSRLGDLHHGVAAMDTTTITSPSHHGGSDGGARDAVLDDVEAILAKLQGPKLESLVCTFRATSAKVVGQQQHQKGGALSSTRQLLGSTITAPAGPAPPPPLSPAPLSSPRPYHRSTSSPSPPRRKLAATTTTTPVVGGGSGAKTFHFGESIKGSSGGRGAFTETWGGGGDDDDPRTSNRRKLKRGLGLLVVAAEQGHPAAQATLGGVYRSLGQMEEAMRWYRLGAQQDDANAQNNLGLLLLLHRQRRHRRREQRQQQDEEEQEEEDDGDDKVMQEREEEEAIRLFRAAVANGSKHACNNLGVCLERRSSAMLSSGEHDASTCMQVKEDACRAYKLGASRGCPQAMANLGENLAREALVVLSSPSTTSLIGGNNNTAMMLTTTKRRGSAAAAAMEAAGPAGDAVRGAVSMLQEGVQWLRKAVEAGATESCYDLGVIYEQGALGFPPDPLVAFSYYKHAADQPQGHARAACRVGDMAYSGKGVAVDYELAVAYYEQAGRAGNADALNSLGIMLEEGKGMLRKNAELAQAFYQRAADLGHAHAAYNLGLLLWRHDPVRVLTRLASKRTANSRSEEDLGGREEVEDVQAFRPQDLQASLAAFELAARLGHPQAEKDAHRIRLQMRHSRTASLLLLQRQGSSSSTTFTRGGGASDMAVQGRGPPSSGSASEGPSSARSDDTTY